MIEKSDDITNYEGYKLKIEKEVITIIAKQPNGAFYGLLTLRDILNSDNQLCLEIEDYPDLAVRGVMLDISRSKVPTLDTLKKLVVMFATLRYNHLELYIEGFSFAVATESQEPTVYLVNRQPDGHCTFEVASQEWMDNYMKTRMAPIEE